MTDSTKNPAPPLPASILGFQERRDITPKYDPNDPNWVLELIPGPIDYSLTIGLPDGTSENVPVSEAFFDAYFKAQLASPPYRAWIVETYRSLPKGHLDLALELLRKEDPSLVDEIQRARGAP